MFTALIMICHPFLDLFLDFRVGVWWTVVAFHFLRSDRLLTVWILNIWRLSIQISVGRGLRGAGGIEEE